MDKKNKKNIEEDKKADIKEEKDSESKDEKKEDKKAIKKPKKLSLRKKQNRQIIWAIILMVGVLLIIMLVPYVIKNYFNKFIYINLDFEKTQLGEILFYSTTIPVVDSNDEISGVYTTNFRSDPRKSGDIEVDIPSNLIGFEREKPVYISFNPGMQVCEGNNTLALMNLAGFLKDFGGLDIKSAVHIKDAEAENVPYITCDNSPDNTVITLTSGEKTMIKKADRNCYDITYTNCEVIPVTEKFMLIILEEYMSYFTRE